jgi:copper(I)-binding protein
MSIHPHCHRRLARRAAVAAAGLVLGLAAVAQGAGTIKVLQPWSRATTAGQTVGGGYLVLSNEGGGADRLVSASTPAAERVELHSMALEGDVMRMRQVNAIDVPAGGKVELKPGGLHLMLTGLKAPLKAGTTVPVTLNFEKSGPTKVELEVRGAGPDAASGAAHHHKH